MAWTTPRTWASAEVPTAALFNAHIRDNLNETSAAVVTTAGDLVYADAANSMGSRLGIGAAGFSLVSTGSAPVWRDVAYSAGNSIYEYSGLITSWVDLDSGAMIDADAQSVSVTLTTGTQAFVLFGARHLSNDTIGQNVQLSYRIGGTTGEGVGVTTLAASTAWGTVNESDPAGTRTSAFRGDYRTSLTAGVNVFTLQTQASGGVTAVLGGPWIMVKAL